VQRYPPGGNQASLPVYFGKIATLCNINIFLKKKSALLKVEEFLSSFDCGSGYDSPVTVYSYDLLVVLQPQTQNLLGKLPFSEERLQPLSGPLCCPSFWHSLTGRLWGCASLKFFVVSFFCLSI
jgi:hypothetical protein